MRPEILLSLGRVVLLLFIVEWETPRQQFYRKYAMWSICVKRELKGLIM